MFNSKMQNHDVYAVTISKNDYNEEITTLSTVTAVPMVIALNGANKFNSNDINVIQCNYVAITPCSSISKGAVIDKQYEVEYIVACAHENYLYLKEYENGGRINI